MNKRSFFSCFVSPTIFAGIAVLCLAGCGSNNQPAATGDSLTAMPDLTSVLPDPASFRDTVNGQPTSLHIMHNERLAVAITNYGARIVSLVVRNTSGDPTDVVLGYDSVGKYVRQPDTYFGAIVGRYGNRIGKARFRLNGKEYALFRNNGPNTLHGGKKVLMPSSGPARPPATTRSS